MSNVVKAEPKNEIVVYQPNETLRLEVRVADESVWLSQSKIGELFGVDRSVVNRHIHNIYKTGELNERATCAKIAQVQKEGGRQITRVIPFYDLDMIIAVGYRVNSFEATQFRIWATQVLRNYLLNGLAVNCRYDALALEMGRRFAEQDSKIVELRKDVDYFISSSLPPKEKVFVEGKMLDAQAELTRIVDNTVWHIGASLKDAGSALFAMMKMELDPSVILGLLP